MSSKLCNSAVLATIMAVVIAGNIQAQSQANINVNASASVLTALTIAGNGAQGLNVNFGDVGATTNGVVFLDPKGLSTSNYIGTSANVGSLVITGANSQSISIGWPTNITLSSGSNTLNYVLEVGGKNANTQGSSSTMTLSGGYVSVTTSSTGSYYLWIGGSLGGTGTSPAALSSQAAGTYTGTANFTVEYN